MALRPTRPQTRAEQLAERNAAQADVFMREVDDALREDQMMAALRRWGKPVGAAIVVGLAALGGGLWWNSHRAEQTERNSEQLTIAMDQIEALNPKAADLTLAGVAADGGKGAKAVAQLMQAGIAAQAKKTDDAAKLYAAVAADDSAPKPYRDLATVREVALRFDAMKPEDVVARLKPLAAPGNPWFGSAGELLAAAYLKQGHKEMAAQLFGAISKDKDTPDSLRARSRQMAGLLGFDAVEDIAAGGGTGAGAGADAAAPAPAAAPVKP